MLEWQTNMCYMTFFFICQPGIDIEVPTLTKDGYLSYLLFNKFVKSNLHILTVVCGSLHSLIPQALTPSGHTNPCPLHHSYDQSLSTQNVWFQSLEACQQSKYKLLIWADRLKAAACQYHEYLVTWGRSAN